MPQNLSRGGLSPFELAKAYRDIHPKKFDDLDDNELIQAIRDVDPESYQLMDPLLEGADILAPTRSGKVPRLGKFVSPEPSPAPSLVPPAPGLSPVVPTALRVVPAVAGALAGTALLPGIGTAAGGGIGAGLGSTAAQYYEKAFGPREEINPGSIALDTALGAINPGARGASALARTASQVAYGSVLSGVGGEGHRLIEEGRMSTAPELGMDLALGGAFGGLTHGAAEVVGHQLSKLPGADFSLPDAVAPPPPMLDPIQKAMAFSEFNQGMRKAVVSESGRAVPELNRLVQAKDYLQRLADIDAAPIPVPPIQPGLTESPYAPPLALPPGRGDVVVQAFPSEQAAELAPPAPTGMAYSAPSAPAEASVPAVAQALEESLNSPPGVPQLVLTSPRGDGAPGTATGPGGASSNRRGASQRPGTRTLRTAEAPGGPGAGTYSRTPGSSTAAGQPPEGPYIEGGVPASTPRGTPGRSVAPVDPEAVHSGRAVPQRQSTLIDVPRASTKGPVRSPAMAEMGGAPPDPLQPRLGDADQRGPGTTAAITTPRPLNRTYATGPNAGPRREGEAHGTSRVVRRQVRTGKKISYENAPSTLKAEDPGTYPPEVRREMAAMAWELETYPYEKGGITYDVPGGNRPNMPGGAGHYAQSTPGAPVYHDILQAAGGSFPSNATRATVLRHVRGALLEGRGSGLTDAAAQVARERLAQRASGNRAGARTIQSRADEGDALIGWRDEATGEAATPSHDLDEFQRAARESTDGEILNAVRVHDSVGDLHEDTLPFFDAARAEAVRRGLIDPEQLDLTMEGPGGAKGPGLLDFEGDVPQAPTLPGLEGVRQEQRAQPPVADAPFSLTAPNYPGVPSRRQGSLLDQLTGEEGVLILNASKGDRAGLKRWMKQHEQEHGGEAWYARVEQAMEDGDWDRAWKAAAGASLRSYSKARGAAQTPQQEAALDQALKGTPFQSNVEAQVVARGRESRQGLPVVRGSGEEFPPAPTMSAAAGERGRAKVGPAGIVNPGPPQKPLEPKYTDHLLSRTLQQSILEETDPDLLTLVPGNKDTNLRLYRQVADLAFQGVNSKDVKQYLKLSDQEIAQHYLRSVQEAARTLQQLSAFRQTNAKTLDQLANQMSMGGALRGMLGGEAPTIVGRRGRVIGKVGDIQPARTLEVLAEETRSFDQLMLTNALQKPRKASEWDLLHGSSYPFMVSKLATAVRNAVTGMKRYGIESLDEAFRIPYEVLMGTKQGVAEAQGLLRERLRSAVKPSAVVTPRRSWKEGIQDLYDITAQTLEGMSPEDARRSLKLLQEFPSEEANFLGWAGGEDLETGKSRFRLINTLIDPKLQRLLTVFNRAQEFTGRAMVFDATVRGQLRARGLDPDVVLQQPPTQIAEAVGGPQALEEILHSSTAASLEATFASRAAKDSVPAALLRFINQAGFLKLGYPFPKFNLVAAPRFLWDHGPWALMDLMRFPLDAVGLTSGTAGGSRLYRGVRAQHLVTEAIPELVGKRQAAQTQLGASVRELLATRRELAVRSRQVTRLEGRGGAAALPGGPDPLGEARAAVEQLTARRTAVQRAIGDHKSTIRDLQSQEETLLDLVRDAHGINAPNLPQYFARVSTGMAMLGAAFVVRNSDGAKGTRWYEYRVDREGKDPLVLDVRPFAPFAQYLFVADVLQDFYQHTDWAKAKAQAGEEGGTVAGPMDWSRATWDNYQGKYTAGELGTQFVQAFLSISRAAGTTLTITDLLTANGVPGPQDFLDAIIGTTGQFLSRYSIPVSQATDVAAVFDPEEAKARIPPRATLDEPFRPLAAPLANIPYVRDLIPERISQTTGKAVATETPALRLAGIGTSPRDFVTEEIRRIGVPGPSVYIRETGDYGLDRLVAETYGRILTQELPAVLEDETYRSLGTPAQQRDYLQQYVFPALKRAALGETREALGEERYQGAMVRGEGARRKARQMELIAKLEGESGIVPAEEPTAPEAPPPPPAPFAPF